MNTAFGIFIFFLAIVVFLTARYYFLKMTRDNGRVVFRQLRIESLEGFYLGPMVYLVSLITLFLGPISYRLVSVNQLEYNILNAIAAFFFVLFYPPFSPITGFATIDVLEKGNQKYCIVGKLMRRKLTVLSIRTEEGVDIIAGRGKRKYVFHAIITTPGQQ